MDKIDAVACLGTAEEHPLRSREEKGICQDFGQVPKPSAATGDFPWDRRGG